jgi:hypothetical protein
MKLDPRDGRVECVVIGCRQEADVDVRLECPPQRSQGHGAGEAGDLPASMSLRARAGATACGLSPRVLRICLWHGRDLASGAERAAAPSRRGSRASDPPRAPPFAGIGGVRTPDVRASAVDDGRSCELQPPRLLLRPERSERLRVIDPRARKSAAEGPSWSMIGLTSCGEAMRSGRCVTGARGTPRPRSGRRRYRRRGRGDLSALSAEAGRFVNRRLRCRRYRPGMTGGLRVRR